MVFKHLEIESKWQKYWEENKTFKTDTYDNSKPKYYVLDMFPYPSGEGLHVGHPEGYTATDIVARYKRMQGYNVLHPMGWDAFGLPAEQYAVKTNNHPSVFTYKNIETFKKQVKMLGMSYDWDREVATCDTDFYKWTQWIFTELYKRDLAYVASMPVNFCPELGTVLANEEVIDGKSEVGGFEVIRKPMRQWVLKITEYAERLLDDLDDLDWPEATKQMQRNWIGKSEGANVDFKVANTDYQFTVFTTRPDTLFGATYCVLAPEHELVNLITTSDKKEEIEKYQEKVLHKSELERSELNKEKTGVFTGAYAINPVNNKLIPIYIADYVLVTYGTGAIMAVPAHDQRDYDFAKQFNLDIVAVIDGSQELGNNYCIEKEAYEGDGVHINSDFINGLDKKAAIDKMIEWLEQKGVGKKQISYKLRDWLFSRQRYWGEPIPIIFMEDGTTVCLEKEQLPLVLPEMDEFKPSGTGESPLANATEWLEVEINGKKGKRETNTMPQWAGSCWYYIRYLDPNNTEAIADEKVLENWLPVDLYIGGAEHAVGHLLYARFWHKVLYDIGVVKTKEPFQKLFHQGMILGENNEKMSKSRGNVINPDDIVKSHGADSLRLHEMFMGPLEAAIAWSDENLDGARRWLDRVYRLFMMEDIIVEKNDQSLEKVYHQTVKKVTKDYDALAFNTAISQMMIFINEAYKTKKIYRPYAEGFVKMLSCICPHLGEELWQYLGHENTLANEAWPEYDESKLIDDIVTVVVQVNGKLRKRLEVEVDTQKEVIENLALNDEHIKQYTNNKEIVKIIYVKNKLLNIVVK